MKLFLSGPMTGYPEFNRPAFNKLARELRDLGHEVVNPAENVEPACGSWKGWMRLSIRQLCDCEGVVMMAGWICSAGATEELRIARVLGIPAWDQSLIHCVPIFYERTL